MSEDGPSHCYTIKERQVTAISETQNFCIEVLLVDPEFHSEIQAGDYLEIVRTSRFHELQIQVEEVLYPESPLPYAKFVLVKGRVYPSGVIPIGFKQEMALRQVVRELREQPTQKRWPAPASMLLESVEKYLRALDWKREH